MKSMSVHLKHL
jgi:serine/threonine protein kinase